MERAARGEDAAREHPAALPVPISLIAEITKPTPVVGPLQEIPDGAY